MVSYVQYYSTLNVRANKASKLLGGAVKGRCIVEKKKLLRAGGKGGGGGGEMHRTRDHTSLLIIDAQHLSFTF